MFKVIISGAAGRMGRSLVLGVQESHEFTLFGALESIFGRCGRLLGTVRAILAHSWELLGRSTPG